VRVWTSERLPEQSVGVPELEIARLIDETPVDPAAHLDQTKVARYAEMLDELPPVVVFKTEQGLLLVDGYHRVAAAQMLGRTTVAADLKTGTRSVALRYAVEHAASERGITAEQAAAAITRRSEG
jgi:ParB-like chromosome segregation protein Spo0J